MAFIFNWKCILHFVLAFCSLLGKQLTLCWDDNDLDYLHLAHTKFAQHFCKQDNIDNKKSALGIYQLL